jgi:hypothetical protein
LGNIESFSVAQEMHEGPNGSRTIRLSSRQIGSPPCWRYCVKFRGAQGSSGRTLCCH